jgi:hypothetical protein
MGFLAAFVIHKQPLNGALVWALIVGILIVVADWAEPPTEVAEVAEELS